MADTTRDVPGDATWDEIVTDRMTLGIADIHKPAPCITAADRLTAAARWIEHAQSHPDDTDISVWAVRRVLRCIDTAEDQA